MCSRCRLLCLLILLCHRRHRAEALSDAFVWRLSETENHARFTTSGIATGCSTLQHGASFHTQKMNVLFLPQLQRNRSTVVNTAWYSITSC